MSDNEHLNSNCGCLPEESPELNCGATLEIPIDQYNCQTTPQNTPTQSNSISFYSAQNGFVVPSVGNKSSLLVPNASFFTAGQWVQFVNPTGTFRVTAVIPTSNVIELTNAASDGATAITGNPASGYQYVAGSKFVTVSQPSQLTNTQFNSLVQQSLSSLASICLDSIPAKSNAEQVNILSYVRTSQCGDVGCCLRKQESLYIDNAGILNYSGTIVAERFSVPVPVGGVSASNPQVNKNDGTGGGYLMPFINPSTGATEYVDLFSGITNNSAYFFFLSSQGRLTLAAGTTEKVYEIEKFFHNSKEGKTAAYTYSGLTSTLIDVADTIGETVPNWVNAVNISIKVMGNTNSTGRLKIKFNEGDTTEMVVSAASTTFAGYEEFSRIVKLSSEKKFRVAIEALSGLSGATSGIGFDQSGAALGYIQLSISALKLVTW
jgi:hypothetical protein